MGKWRAFKRTGACPRATEQIRATAHGQRARCGAPWTYGIRRDPDRCRGGNADQDECS